MVCWVTWIGLFTNAHTLADSPSDACQYPTILWYDTVDNQTILQSDLEHVSCFIYKNPQLYKLINVAASEKFYDPTLRLTMDTAEDFRLIKNIFEALYFSNKFFSLGNILEYLGKNVGLKKINKDVQHNWINVANNR